MGKEIINLGHGSGGLLSRKLLDTFIFSTFDNPYLQKKHDGAVLSIDGPLAISTDTFVVSPIFFRGGNIGDLAVHGTVNDVAMCGGIPEYLSLAFVVEEGLLLEEFEKIIKTIKARADECGVSVITGDTKVVERGKGDKIFINTTGFGKMHPNADIDISRVNVGDKIIINAPIAAHGMAIMSQREGLEFESEIISDTTNLNGITKAVLDRFGESVHLFRDATRGGVASVLSEIATDTGFGVFIKEKDLPIEKQVAAACEMLGLDPLYVANEGVFVSFVAPEIETEVIRLMREHDKGRNAVCIGEVTNDHPGNVVMESAIGGQRIVTPLIGEQLPRIC